MIKFIVNPNDNRYLFLTGSEEDIRGKQIKNKMTGGLEQHLNKFPSYMFLPTFRGIPRPEVFLEHFTSKKTGETIYYCPFGLWQEVVDFCNKKQKQIDWGNFKRETVLTDSQLYYPGSLEDFKKVVSGWNLSIQPRPYQLEAAWKILTYKKSLSELATRAGKTLIFNIIARWMKEHGAKKILMIVPSIQLVKQGVKDLNEYNDGFWKSEMVWAEGEEVVGADLTIGTFQSLVLRCDPRSKRYDPDFYNDYDVVCVDEAHKIPCKSIQVILKQNFIKNVKLLFGFTGTLPKPNTIEWLCCQAMAGPKIQEIAAKELVDEGFLAKPKITQYRIQYTEDQIRTVATRCAEYLCSIYKMDGGKKILLPKEQREFTIQHEKYLPTALQKAKELYEPQEYYTHLVECLKAGSGAGLLSMEQMLVHRSKVRLKLMDKLLTDIDKNVIVFAHNTEYIDFLEKHFKEKFPDRQVLKIKGATNLKKRQEAIDKMLEANNCILVASYGVASTGLTFRNVDYGMFAQSFKSDTINSQSLGRLMLRTEQKSDFQLYDIIDEFPTHFIYNQGLAKCREWKNDGWEYDIINIKA